MNSNQAWWQSVKACGPVAAPPARAPAPKTVGGGRIDEPCACAERYKAATPLTYGIRDKRGAPVVNGVGNVRSSSLLAPPCVSPDRGQKRAGIRVKLLEEILEVADRDRRGHELQPTTAVKAASSSEADPWPGDG